MDASTTTTRDAALDALDRALEQWSATDSFQRAVQEMYTAVAEQPDQAWYAAAFDGLSQGHAVTHVTPRDVDVTVSVDPAALYVVWGGANNFFNGEDEPSVPIGQMEQQLTRLAVAGVRQLLIPNLPPLGSTPATGSIPATEAARAARASASPTAAARAPGADSVRRARRSSPLPQHDAGRVGHECRVDQLIHRIEERGRAILQRVGLGELGGGVTAACIGNALVGAQ